MLREGMSGPSYQMHPLPSPRSSPSFYCTPPPVLNSLLILTLSHKHLPRVESLVSSNTLSQSISKNDPQAAFVPHHHSCPPSYLLYHLRYIYRAWLSGTTYQTRPVTYLRSFPVSAAFHCGFCPPFHLSPYLRYIYRERDSLVPYIQQCQCHLQRLVG